MSLWDLSSRALAFAVSAGTKQEQRMKDKRRAHLLSTAFVKIHL